MPDFISNMEMYNAAHFIKGFVICLAAWIFALKHKNWIFFKHVMGPVLFSFAVTIIAAVGYEFYDLSRGLASDGFSWMDILFDTLGAVGVHTVHLSTHQYDEDEK